MLGTCTFDVYEVSSAADVLRDARCHVEEAGIHASKGTTCLAGICQNDLSLSHAERDIFRYAASQGLLPAQLYTVSIEVCTPDGLNQENVPLPLILPHELFSALFSAGPERWAQSVTGSPEALADYWDGATRCDWYQSHPAVQQGLDTTIPMGFYGDGARFSQNDSMEAFCWNSILTATVGSPLDNRFLIACVPTARCLPWTLHQIAAPIAWSFSVLLDGTWPSADHLGRPWQPRSLRAQRAGTQLAAGWRAAFVESRGDWEFQVRLYRLQGYRHNNMCHLCAATLKDGPLSFANFSPDAGWRATLKTSVDFFQTRPLEEHCPLVRVPGFALSMLRIDTMHTICLGLGRFLNAAVLLWLCRSGHARFGEGSLDQRLRRSWVCFKAWCYTMSVMTTQRVFCLKRIGPKGWLTHEYPELLTKAWNSRIITAWLADEACQAQAREVGDGEEERCLVQAVTYWLAKAYSIMEGNPRNLSAEVADGLARCFEELLSVWTALSNLALEVSALGWPVRPKWHLIAHLADIVRADRVNPRHYHCFRDEDQVGTLIKVAASSHRSTVSISVLNKYLLRLGLRWAGRGQLGGVSRRRRGQVGHCFGRRGARPTLRP